MPQPEHASDAAVERLLREVAADRARLAFAMQLSEGDKTPESTGVGRLYRVFLATGQAQ